MSVEGAENLSFAPLAECPVLKSLTIRGELMVPGDLDTLNRSRSLRNLVIESAYLDNTAVRWLSRSESIVNVSLGRNCVLTDEGVRKLSENKSLESLDIGGFITLKGAESLNSLPHLRRLTLRSSLISEADQASLKSRLACVSSVSVIPFSHRTHFGIAGVSDFGVRHLRALGPTQVTSIFRPDRGQDRSRSV